MKFGLDGGAFRILVELLAVGSPFVRIHKADKKQRHGICVMNTESITESFLGSCQDLDAQNPRQKGFCATKYKTKILRLVEERPLEGKACPANCVVWLRCSRLSNFW